MFCLKLMALLPSSLVSATPVILDNVSPLENGLVEQVVDDCVGECARLRDLEERRRLFGLKFIPLLIMDPDGSRRRKVFDPLANNLLHILDPFYVFHHPRPGDACASGHDLREGRTSEARCMALHGCCFNSGSDNCYDCSAEVDWCEIGHTDRVGATLEEQCIAMRGCCYSTKTEKCWDCNKALPASSPMSNVFNAISDEVKHIGRVVYDGVVGEAQRGWKWVKKAAGNFETCIEDSFKGKTCTSSDRSSGEIDGRCFAKFRNRFDQGFKVGCTVPSLKARATFDRETAALEFLIGTKLMAEMPLFEKQWKSSHVKDFLRMQATFAANFVEAAYLDFGYSSKKAMFFQTPGLNLNFDAAITLFADGAWEKSCPNAGKFVLNKGHERLFSAAFEVGPVPIVVEIEAEAYVKITPKILGQAELTFGIHFNGGCEDKLPDCHEDKCVEGHVDFHHWRKNCRVTCGYCGDSRYLEEGCKIGDRAIQCGNFRIANLLTGTDDVLSFGHSNGKVAMVLYPDHTTYDLSGADMQKYNPWKENLGEASGVNLGNHYIEIGNYRLADIDNGAMFAVSHKNGKTNILWRADGTEYPNPQSWNGGSGYKKPAGRQGVAFSHHNFIQIGSWRMGEHGDSFTFTHRGGKAAAVLNSDGELAKGPKKNYNLWSNKVAPSGIDIFKPVELNLRKPKAALKTLVSSLDPSAIKKQILERLRLSVTGKMATEAMVDICVGVEVKFKLDGIGTSIDVPVCLEGKVSADYEADLIGGKAMADASLKLKSLFVSHGIQLPSLGAVTDTACGLMQGLDPTRSYCIPVKKCFDNLVDDVCENASSLAHKLDITKRSDKDYVLAETTVWSGRYTMDFPWREGMNVRKCGYKKSGEICEEKKCCDGKNCSWNKRTDTCEDTSNRDDKPGCGWKKNGELCHKKKCCEEKRCLWNDLTKSCETQPTEAPPTDPETIVQIKTPFGYCLRGWELSSKGHNEVDIEGCNPSARHHQWLYNEATGQIKVPVVNKCLDAYGRNKKGGKVALWPCDTSNENQQWIYDANSGQIKAKFGKCLDAGDRNDNPRKVHMWNCDTRNDNQKWVLSVTPAIVQIKSQDGICLDASERKKKGGKVHMWGCNTFKKNQQWLYYETTGQIRPYDSYDTCLDADERSTKGGKVHMWTCDPSNLNQQWTYDANSGQIKVKDGKCLDASKRNDNGGLVHIWDCNTENLNQKWIMSVQPQILQIKIKDAHCLEVSVPDKNVYNGIGKVHMWWCKPQQENQHWLYDPANEQIKSVANGKCLEALESNKRDGKVTMSDCDTSNPDQRWIYTQNPGNAQTFGQIKAKHGKCLDASQKRDNGGAVVMWDCERSNGNQKWELTASKGGSRRRAAWGSSAGSSNAPANAPPAAGSADDFPSLGGFPALGGGTVRPRPTRRPRGPAIVPAPPCADARYVNIVNQNHFCEESQTAKEWNVDPCKKCKRKDGRGDRQRETYSTLARFKAKIITATEFTTETGLRANCRGANDDYCKSDVPIMSCYNHHLRADDKWFYGKQIWYGCCSGSRWQWDSRQGAYIGFMYHVETTTSP